LRRALSVWGAGAFVVTSMIGIASSPCRPMSESRPATPSPRWEFG
jgi:hypothetical protein